MASYTIGVTAFEYSEADSVENPENAYDNSASTYATVGMANYAHVYLYSFNFSKIPQDEVVTSITAKVKASGEDAFGGDCLVWLQSTADSTGVKLSFDTELGTSVSTKTLSLTADVSTIMSYASTLSVAFYTDGADATFDIYAVYFTVTTTEAKPNKVIYGNETLIDLTGDTAKASDVASGKTFHLASGIQATGTLSLSPSSVTIDTTTASTVLRALTCSGLTKEPSWFVLIFYASNGGSTGRTKRIMHALYDGTTLATWNVSSTEGAVNRYTDRCSFSYSSGTLTLTITNSTNYPYFGQGTWELYYL